MGVPPVQLWHLPVLVRLELTRTPDGDRVLAGRVRRHVPAREASGHLTGSGDAPGGWDRDLTERTRNAFFDRWEPIFDRPPRRVPVPVPAVARLPERADGLRLFARLHRADRRLGPRNPDHVRVFDLDVGADLVVDLAAETGELHGDPGVLDAWARLVADWQACGAPAFSEFTVQVSEPAAAQPKGRWRLRAGTHLWVQRSCPLSATGPARVPRLSAGGAPPARAR